MSVRDGDDENASGFDAVDDAERVTPKQIPTSAVVEGWPRVEEFGNSGFGGIDLFAEPRCRRDAALGIPTRGRLGLF